MLNPPYSDSGKQVPAKFSQLSQYVQYVRMPVKGLWGVNNLSTDVPLTERGQTCNPCCYSEQKTKQELRDKQGEE